MITDTLAYVLQLVFADGFRGIIVRAKVVFKLVVGTCCSGKVTCDFQQLPLIGVRNRDQCFLVHPEPIRVFAYRPSNTVSVAKADDLLLT